MAGIGVGVPMSEPPPTYTADTHTERKAQRRQARRERMRRHGQLAAHDEAMRFRREALAAHNAALDAFQTRVLRLAAEVIESHRKAYATPQWDHPETDRLFSMAMDAHTVTADIEHGLLRRYQIEADDDE